MAPLNKSKWTAFVLIPFVVSACSFGKVASDITSGIFKDGSPIFEQDGDIETSETAGLAMIKTLEVFYYANPGNRNYLFLLAKAYGTYAFGFLENRMIQYKNDPAKYQIYADRAKLFYSRGKQYGMQLMKREDGGFKKAVETGLLPLQKKIKHYGKHDVASMFWLAFNWGSLINLSKDDITAVADLPLVEAMMARVLEVNPAFYFAGPQLFYGVYYASRPAMLGGSPDKAKEHFAEAERLTGGKALMVYALQAQFLATQLLDKALFEELLGKVDAGSVDADPAQRLANALAKERAKLLRAHEAAYF